jgi:predicted N-acetyltransferase YhbS
MSYELRLLHEAELDLIWTIDRREVITHLYRLCDGQLVEESAYFDMQGWPPSEAQIYGPILAACYACGGVFQGAFADTRLAGVAVVDRRWLGPQHDLLQLAFLHVSYSDRGNGLGQRLFSAARAAAQDLGTNGLYILATPSVHTIRFYQFMGSRLIEYPDPELYAQEPEDIHLECRFTP